MSSQPINFLLTIVWAICLIAVCNDEVWLFKAQALPRDQSCGGSSTWIRGAPYGQMRVANYSTSKTGCKVTITPVVSTYLPNQTFTINVTASQSVAYKIESVGGAILTPGSGGVRNSGRTDCLDYQSKIKTVLYTMKAPYQGANITLRAICGTDQVVMYVANEIIMAPGPGVLPPPDPNGPSTDPAYAYQAALSTGLLFRHYRNDTHAKFKLEYTGTGYVSIGLGTAMIGSTVLVGVDTTANAGMAGVSLYKIVSKTAPVGTLLASGATLINYGITDAAYSVASGISSLKWTMAISAQQAQFTFVPAVGTKETLIWAVGGAVYDKHSAYGFFQNFEAGVAATPTPAPAPATSGTSTDSNYAFQTSLGTTAILQYKKNATHISFKVHMDAIGYLAFGPGSGMIGSNVLIGMDPTTNPGYPGVGLYNLVSKTGSNSQVMTNMAVTPTALASYGVVDTSYVVVNGTSELKFAVDLANQNVQFTLYPNGPVNAIWAAGGSSYGLHSSYGTLVQLDFGTGTGGNGTLPPTTSAPTTPPPAISTGTSSDPNYSFQTPLGTAGIVQYKQNVTHLSVKVHMDAVGYLSFGPGSAMVGSNVLIGMNPTSNPGYPAVGLYNLVTKIGSNSQVTASIGLTATALSVYGIVGASYIVFNGTSELKFTLILSQQTAQFTLCPNGPVNAIWAAGSAVYGLHSSYGVLPQINFATGSGGNGPAPPLPSPAPAPVPAPAPRGTSTDSNYAYQTSLGGTAILQYKLNDTHLSFKVHMDANGYLSFGPGIIMVGSNVLIGMDPTSNPGYPAVGLYNLVSKTGSNIQTTANLAAAPTDLAKYGIVDSSFAVTNGASELKFALELAKQKPEFTLYPGNGLVDAIWAAGDMTYGLHSSYGFVPQINFATGAGGTAVAMMLDLKLVAHILTMILAWEVFSPIGVVIPLLNNAKHGQPAMCRMSAPTWLKYHWVLLTVGVLLGYIGTVTGYLYVESKGSAHWASTHTILGLAMLLGSIIQPIWGHFRPAKAKTGETRTFLRAFFDGGHPLFGYALVFAGISTSLLGVPELQKVLAGQDYLLVGLQGSPGFSGAMGMVIVVLGAAFTLLMLAGFYRGLLNRIAKPKAASDMLVIGHKQVAIEQLFPMREVQSHANHTDCWVVYKARVYDVTEFLSTHPGGKKAILQYAGKDMTEAFNDIGHSMEALNILNRFYIGDVDGPQQSDPEVGHPIVQPGASASNTCLTRDNTVRHRVTLREKVALSHNVFMLKFALPKSSMTLGLPVGKHIALFAPNIAGKARGQWNGRPDPEANKSEIQRKYTPTSNDHGDIGYFTLVIKCYRPTAQYPDGGKMGRYLNSLKVGDTVQMAGPFGTHQYLGNGIFNDNGRQVKVSQIAMIAGGSGITPIWQIATAMLLDPNDPCKLSIVYANSTVDDILLKSELDDLERRFPNRIRIWYTVSKVPTGVAWNYSVGRVSKEMLQQRFPHASPDAIVITCGPQPMVDCAANLLKDLGFSDEQRIDY